MHSFSDKRCSESAHEDTILSFSSLWSDSGKPFPTQDCPVLRGRKAPSEGGDPLTLHAEHAYKVVTFREQETGRKNGRHEASRPGTAQNLASALSLTSRALWARQSAAHL